MAGKPIRGAASALRSRFADRLFLLKAVVCFGFLAAFLLAPRLFLRHPFLAPLPVLPGIPSIPPPVDLAVLIALGGLLVPILVLRRPRKLLIAWCALFACRAVWDQSVWQPYFYEYFFILLSLVFAAREPGDDEAKDTAVLDGNRALIASVYFWSGLNKFNHRFLHYSIMAVFPGLAPAVPARYAPHVGLIMAVLETAVGIALLGRRSRRIAVIAGIAMHVSVLSAIGPWAGSHNRVVWPWNVAMILLLVVVFGGRQGAGLACYLSPRAPAFHRIVLVFFVLGPVSSFAGLWPAYFSFKLYSFNTHWGTIFFTSRMVEALPARVRAEVTPIRAGPYAGYVAIAPWSEHELGAFLPPEPAVFKEVARRLCALAPAPNDLLLVLQDPPDWRTGETRKTSLDCVGLGTPARGR
ncbi:MAG TPA: hypothetical protein VGT40_17660 [Methylomirabilota bacterium]|jgi:hypothetical protein|nr:hypothetical protein [Methylomirabilota bacterium]